MKLWLINLKRILWEDSFDAVELFGSVNAFLWGGWFLTHYELFTLGDVYRILASFGSIEKWGMILIGLGFLKLYGVLSDRYLFRKWISLLATIIWTFILITFWQANASSILIPLTFEITLYSIWEFFRHARRHQRRVEIRKEIKEGTLTL